MNWHQLVELRILIPYDGFRLANSLGSIGEAQAIFTGRIQPTIWMTHAQNSRSGGLLLTVITEHCSAMQVFL